MNVTLTFLGPALAAGPDPLVLLEPQAASVVVRPASNASQTVDLLVIKDPFSSRAAWRGEGELVGLGRGPVRGGAPSKVGPRQRWGVRKGSGAPGRAPSHGT